MPGDFSTTNEHDGASRGTFRKTEAAFIGLAEYYDNRVALIRGFFKSVTCAAVYNRNRRRRTCSIYHGNVLQVTAKPVTYFQLAIRQLSLQQILRTDACHLWICRWYWIWCLHAVAKGRSICRTTINPAGSQTSISEPSHVSLLLDLLSGS